MNLHRMTIYFTALLAVAMVTVPSSAMASSLLSGYGGPGQGNQAVLGSALVNGPKSGGGSGHSGGSSATRASQPEIEGTGYRDVPSEAGEASPAEVSRGGSGRSSRAIAAKGSSKAARADRRRSDASGRTAVKPAASELQPFYPAAERVPSGSQGGLLGLSGADVVYVLIAFAVLVLLGVFTRRIAADPEGSARG